MFVSGLMENNLEIVEFFFLKSSLTKPDVNPKSVKTTKRKIQLIAACCVYGSMVVSYGISGPSIIPAISAIKTPHFLPNNNPDNTIGIYMVCENAYRIPPVTHTSK